MSAPKKLFIKTYGCQMNVYDSERMAEAMGGRGLCRRPMIARRRGHDPSEHLPYSRKAAEKVYSELGRLKPLKALAKPDLKIGVAGCVAQAEGEEIMRRSRSLILWSARRAITACRRPGEGKPRAGRNRARHRISPKRTSSTTWSSAPESQARPAAFLTVQEGCDKFCAFCVVPYTRGAEVSRPAERIMSKRPARPCRNVACARSRFSVRM